MPDGVTMSDDKPKIYAGIGSRQITNEEAGTLHTIASLLGAEGWVLRSGGASGSDMAFMCGASDNLYDMEVFLPWTAFNRIAFRELDRGYLERGEIVSRVNRAALLEASKHHPAWNNLSPSVRNLHARNVQILLGEHLDRPVTQVVCCASGEMRDRDGVLMSVDGGTGQGVRVAYAHGIPVFNVRNSADLRQIRYTLDF